MQALDVWGHLNCYIHTCPLASQVNWVSGTYEEVMPH